MRDGLFIIDVDCHHWEPTDLFERYVDAEFRDRAPARVAVGGVAKMMVEGEPLVSERSGSYANFASTGGTWGERRWQERMKDAFEAGFDASSRLADMDRSGVDVQVMYPTLMAQVLGRQFDDAELLASCCRAYNDWSRDYCAADPSRLLWSAALPLQDVALAIEEARRAADLGAVGFFVRPNPVCGRNLHHRDYDALWAEIERIDKPVSLHNAELPRLPSFGDRMESHSTAHIISHPFEAMAAITDLVCWGVFERFPRLTMLTVECNAGWLPFLLERMDEHYDRLGEVLNPELTMPPSAYFKRNMFVAAGGDEAMVPAVVALVGDDNVVFNTDYPHPDGSWPDGVGLMLDQPIPFESKRKIMETNARRAFRFG